MRDRMFSGDKINFTEVSYTFYHVCVCVCLEIMIIIIIVFLFFILLGQSCASYCFKESLK